MSKKAEGEEYDPSLKPLETGLIAVLLVLAGLTVALVVSGRFETGGVTAIVLVGTFIFGGQALGAYYEGKPETIHPEVRDDSPVEFGEGDNAE